MRAKGKICCRMPFNLPLHARGFKGELETDRLGIRRTEGSEGIDVKITVHVAAEHRYIMLDPMNPGKGRMVIMETAGNLLFPHPIQKDCFLQISRSTFHER